jgi:RimJ/RimL family protein N-acetyltransferase
MTTIRLIPIGADGSPAQAVAIVPAIAKEAMAATVSLYKRVGYVIPWIGYLALERDTVVGTCAFKSSPQAAHVEIAYFTFPGNEGRGIATAMAKALISLAHKTDPQVIVTAQTLPVENASNTVLRRLGFSFAGPVTSAEDGEVWEWHLQHEQSSDITRPTLGRVPA